MTHTEQPAPQSPKRKPPTDEDVTVRRPLAEAIATLVAERFKNIYGVGPGQTTVKAFEDWIVMEATDRSPETIKLDLDALKWHRDNRPAEWDKRKPWLKAPKGRRLLKTFLTIVREAADAAETKPKTGMRVEIAGGTDMNFVLGDGTAQ